MLGHDLATKEGGRGFDAILQPLRRPAGERDAPPKLSAGAGTADDALMAAEAQRMVARFRTTHDLWADDPAFIALLKRLREGCPEFETWWERHDVRRPASGRKTLHHPDRGVLAYEHASFQVNEDPGLKLVIYTPVAPGVVA